MHNQNIKFKKLILALEIANARQQSIIKDNNISYDLHEKIEHIIEIIEQYVIDQNIHID
jgi:hypothetical protein